MIGRSERGPVEVESYWEKGSTFPNFLYRCADGELIQVWFGGKGMYPTLIEILGDEPSADGYYRDQATGALQARGACWRSVFVRQARDRWIEQLTGRRHPLRTRPQPRRGAGRSPCGPGGAGDRARTEGAHRDVLVAAPISVRPPSPRGRARPHRAAPR